MSTRESRLGPGSPIEDFASPEFRARFRQMQSLRLPRPIYTMRLLLLLSLAVIAAFLVFVPWVQNAAGTGAVITLNPADRSQTITTLAKGRISRWYVRDGSYVEKGDPIVDLVDLDPQLLERLDAELRAKRAAYEAAREASRTALLNLERQKGLFEQGLSARVDFERAQIRYQELLAGESESEAALKQVQIAVTRQSTQRVTAPNDGTVIRIRAGDTATLVNEGEVIAEFVPSVATPAVEIFISGLDASLVTQGRKARIMFEGWPAVQFGGWPEIAIGTFGGVVTVVDPVVSGNGRFRVLVTPDPDERPWPTRRYLRFGAQARGWILLDTVPIGYELWRRLNGFPPENAEPGVMLRDGGE